MKKIRFIIIIIFILYISFLLVKILEKKYILKGEKNNSEIVDIKLFKKSDCNECTKLEEYIEVYKKAGIKFGKISIKEYQTKEYNSSFNKYNIEKLPFIVFSENLNNYDTIKNSWDNTFGYRNNLGEFIPTDIIPPYFDLKTKKIEGLIDIIYIGDNLCLDCYKIDDIKNILSEFGLQFNNINEFNIKSESALYLSKKYKINIFPTVILSKELNLYKNFLYFWKTIGSIEGDGKYILRKPGKLNLKINNYYEN